jgi:hypothetical protein
VKVLLLQPNESVGLEVKDDVHTDLSNNHKILSIKAYYKEKSRWLYRKFTNPDLDLWKTFSNWSKVISDKNDSRSTIPAQLSFVEKTSFVLASNKSSNNSNKVVGIISELQSGNKNESDVRTYFDTLAKRTTNQDLNGYIKMY